MYSGKGNVMLVSQLEDKLHDLIQGEKSVMTYVGELKQLCCCGQIWIILIPWCLPTLNVLWQQRNGLKASGAKVFEGIESKL
jgi:hypothetical protein